MKYFVFAYELYYPSGGMRDIYSIHDNLADAEKAAKAAEGSGYDYVEIMDSNGKELPFDRQRT